MYACASRSGWALLVGALFLAVGALGLSDIEVPSPSPSRSSDLRRLRSELHRGLSGNATSPTPSPSSNESTDLDDDFPAIAVAVSSASVMVIVAVVVGCLCHMREKRKYQLAQGGINGGKIGRQRWSAYARGDNSGFNSKSTSTADQPKSSRLAELVRRAAKQTTSGSDAVAIEMVDQKSTGKSSEPAKGPVSGPGTETTAQEPPIPGLFRKTVRGSITSHRRASRAPLLPSVAEGGETEPRDALHNESRSRHLSTTNFTMGMLGKMRRKTKSGKSTKRGRLNSVVARDIISKPRGSLSTPDWTGVRVNPLFSTSPPTSSPVSSRTSIPAKGHSYDLIRRFEKGPVIDRNNPPPPPSSHRAIQSGSSSNESWEENIPEGLEEDEVDSELEEMIEELSSSSGEEW